MCIKVSKTGVAAGALAGLLVLGSPRTGGAQVVERGCYIPEVGAVYRIGEAGLPDECVETTHVEFSWPAVDHDHQVTNLQGHPMSGQAPAPGDMLSWVSANARWEPKRLRFYRVQAERTIESGELGTYSVVAACEGGDQVTSGGFSNHFAWQNGVEVVESYPVKGYPSDYGRWQVTYLIHEFPVNPPTLFAYAWCLDLTF